MKDVYKTPKRYTNSKDFGCGYANKIIEELRGIETYALAKELSQIGSFLPKDKIGAKSPSDESLQDMIDSGKDFFDIPELPLRLSNNKSEIVKERSFNSR